MIRSPLATSIVLCTRTAAALAMLVGGLVLIGGWALDVAALRSLLPGLATMKVNTALGFAGAGVALWLLQPDASLPRRRAALACAALPTALGLLTLAQYVHGWDLGIDELLFADPGSRAAGAPPGRPAPSTALALLVLGLALLFLDYQTRNGRQPAQALALAAGLIAFIGLLGYAYGVSALYAVELYSSMALHTAIGVFVVALGIVCARPGQGLMAVVTGAGGYITRRLLPVALFVPPVVGGLQLAGERAGLYGFEFGLALFVTANVVVFTVLVLWNAHRLAALDRERLQVLEELRQANEVLEARVAERTAALRNEVAERKKLEDQFRGLFESAPDAIVVSDSAGRIVLVNGQAEQLFGYAREELVGQAIELLIPERARGRHVAHRAGYVAEPHARPMGTGLELFARRKDGSEFPVDIVLSPVPTDAEVLVFSDIRDVTWQKRAEYELRANEARFRAVAETANDAVVSADRHGNIIYFNKAAARIFGYTAEEVLRQPLTLLMPERYHAAHRQSLESFVAGGEGRVVGKTVELAGKRKNGEEFPLELSLASWKIGDEVFFTGMLRDISQRKQAERQIEQLNESLAHRADELEAVNKELEAFSYSVSHDLRAPLRALDGFSQALLEDYCERLDAEGRDHLERVRGAAQRMGHLIDDLLMLSRVTRAELNLEEVDLSALVGRIAEELGKREPRRAAEFVVAPGLRALADVRLLHIALENLMDNAWKFTCPRSVARIQFGLRPHNGEQAYFVQDNGVGFDMTYAGKLFTAFQRLHDAREFPGTGIGLATVQRVIHKHGGRMWVEAAVDQGAVFYFTLS